MKNVFAWTNMFVTRSRSFVSKSLKLVSLSTPHIMKTESLHWFIHEFCSHSLQEKHTHSHTPKQSKIPFCYMHYLRLSLSIRKRKLPSFSWLRIPVYITLSGVVYVLLRRLPPVVVNVYTMVSYSPEFSPTIAPRHHHRHYDHKLWLCGYCTSVIPQVMVEENPCYLVGLNAKAKSKNIQRKQEKD